MSRVRLTPEQQWRSQPSKLSSPSPLSRGVESAPLLVELPPIVEHLDTWGRLAAVRAVEAARAEQRSLLGVLGSLRCPADGRRSWVSAFERGVEEVLGRMGVSVTFELGSEGPLLAQMALQAKPRTKTLSLPKAGQSLWLTRPLGSDVLVEAFRRQVRTASQTRQWLERCDHPGPTGPRGERVLGVQLGVEGLAGAAARMAHTTELDVVLDAGALPAWPGAMEHLFAGVLPDSSEANGRRLGRRFLVTRGVSERAAQLALAADWTGGILWASDRPEKGTCIGELRKPRQKPVVRLLRAVPT